MTDEEVSPADGPDEVPHVVAKMADLVLEGGGVKGIALVGAAMALHDNGYRFERIAGSSAGAIVGAIIVAMQQAGESMDRVDELVRTLNYENMLDRRGVSKFFSWWPALANGIGVLLNNGMYRGAYLEDWTRGVLADLGVRSFGDLRFDDPGSSLLPARSYRLVVTTSDLARQRSMDLPWDLESYGLNPDTFSVARAVRASAAIPFIFEPVTLRSTFGISALADGSLLRSYPIEIFDRNDGKPSRWPTLGIRLSSPSNERAPANPVTGPISLMMSLVYTTVDSTQVRHVSDPENLDRSIFAKPRGVRWTDFDLTPEQQQGLYQSGYAAGAKYLRQHPDGPLKADPRDHSGQIDVG